MTVSSNITGIILAGGKSSRMGMEKGLVKYKEKPLIQYSIDVLKQVCDQILISSNSNAYDDFGYVVLPDSFEDIGPVGGIYTCLEASKTTDNIILSCDTPFISKEYLEYLLANRHHAEVTVPWFGDDRYEPVSAYYHKDFSSSLLSAIKKGNYKLPEIFKAARVNRLKITDQNFYSENLFYNINSPEDIEKLS